jgi:hypothetical protein
MIKRIVIALILIASAYLLSLQIKNSKNVNQKADDIVKEYWGANSFEKYIRLDKEASEYCTFHGNWDKKSSFCKPLDFVPNVYSYKYKINHPLFDSISNPIRFVLDSVGNLMTGFNPRGLNQFEDLDLIKTISKEEAIAIAKKEGLKRYKKEWEAKIDWDNRTGNFIWLVISYFDKPYFKGCYMYNFDAVLIDIKNGNVVSRMTGSQ